MPAFGRDPRSIFLHMMYTSNIWIDTLILPVLFVSLMKRFHRNDSLYLPLPFMAVEIIRICLSTGHVRGNIPVTVFFFIFCIFAIALDFLCIFLIEENTAFFNLIMMGFACLHILQLIFTIPLFRSFSFYKTGYYQFGRGQLQLSTPDEDEIHLIDVEEY